jgi:hypothetical protein
MMSSSYVTRAGNLMATPHVGGDEMTGQWPGWITQSIHDAFAALCEQRHVNPESADDAEARVALWEDFCTMTDADLIALGARRAGR